MKGYQNWLAVLNVVLGSLCGVWAANIPVPDAKLTPIATTTQSNTKNKRNCSDLNAHFLSWNQEEREGILIYEQGHVANCTGEEVIVHETEVSSVEKWKTNVIISCTVTAAVEVFIIIIIILYWKQIRLSLRKLKCPCEESQRNNSSQQPPARRTASHQTNRQSRSTRRNRPPAEESELTPMNSDDPETIQSESRSEPSDGRPTEDIVASEVDQPESVDQQSISDIPITVMEMPGNQSET